MDKDSMGWVGKRVKHVDGREGVIRSESPGFCHAMLFIVDDDGATDMVQLNSNGPDTGSAGWSWCWRAAADGEPEKWGWLGDHNNMAAA